MGITLPEKLTADGAAMVAELAVRALVKCATQHEELRKCVVRHNKGSK